MPSPKVQPAAPERSHIGQSDDEFGPGKAQKFAKGTMNILHMLKDIQNNDVLLLVPVVYSFLARFSKVELVEGEPAEKPGDPTPV